MSGVHNKRRMPTRVTIAARKGSFVAPRRQRNRQLVRSLAVPNSPSSGRRVDLMRKKYVVKQRKTVRDQQTGGTSITIQPRIEIKTKRQLSGSPENPPAAPIKKRRISVISNNITQKMMIQVEPTPSVVTNLAIPSRYTTMQHVPRRNVVKRSEMNRFTIKQAIDGASVATEHVMPLTGVNAKKVDLGKHIFTKTRKALSSAWVNKRPRIRTKPTPSARYIAPQIEDDSSSVYSYSDDESVSEDENRRSKKNLGPVMKSTTVTRGGHIMLRNLPKEINARMLMMELFRDDGDVINAIVHSDEKGLQLGTGEVIFAKRKEAHNAIVRHCGSVWRGKKMKMTMIGQMIEQPMARIMSRRERRRKDTRMKKKGSLRTKKCWDVVAPSHQNTVRVHQSPVKKRDDHYDVVEEPGGDNEEEHTVIEPSEVGYEEEVVHHEVDPPDDTLSKAMDRNGLVLDAGTQFSRTELKAPDASPKRKQQLEYIPAEKEDSTGYHVTLKNLQQYSNLSELTDSDEGERFLRSS